MAALNLSKLGSVYKDREEYLRAVCELAHVAERAERFEDMVILAKEMVKLVGPLGRDLSEEERALVANAFKNLVGQLRASCRILSCSMGAKESTPFGEEYRKLLNAELTTFCLSSLEFFEGTLGKVCAREPPAFVFCLKLIADFCRYLAELTNDKNYVEKANQLYAQALDAADKGMEPTHPVRLGVALNYSVFFYEIVKDAKQGCQLAKAAFASAIAKLDDLDEEYYKESTLLMQLLRDNVTLWTTDAESRA